ncbi:WhiB family transcriptional regulator [Streptomyces sp. NPDC012693]|jgi:WhiB family redox-sensing transcriptional regulator|uniref:WhiB family transcriptional regulator n=1 Tax=unclassified Streptomyces TaxID=2593676 RepID=UPI00093F535B|nr:MULTISPECIES: WhiB family transcriptional regulator [unclassified Streptomyces]OKJ61510.1 transcription factor WhiB [Streptomyces sp. CB02261]
MDSWREAAACQSVDPDLFFPVGTGAPALVQAEEAKAVCRHCPVREACLDWAMDDSRQVTGVWGGLDDDERRSLKRRLRRAAHAGERPHR